VMGLMRFCVFPTMFRIQFVFIVYNCRYYASQQLTEKSDVYSFGVVLLELISGKKPVSSEDYGAEMNIVQWVCATRSNIGMHH